MKNIKEIIHLLNFNKLLQKNHNSTPGDELDAETDFIHSSESDTAEDFRSGAFINSLEDLTEDDIELSEAAAKRAKISLTEWIRRIMFVFFFGMFVVSCVMLVQNLIAKQKGEKIYAQLEAEFFSDGFSIDASVAFQPEEGAVPYLKEDNGDSAIPSMSEMLAEVEQQQDGEIIEIKQYNEELEKVRAKLSSMAQINPDLYGWISVEGTNINYPLVQGEDNDYYLDHAYTGDYLPIGSIFVDYRCHESITKNFNTVIYGHNITSGAMFHDVTKFFKDEYFNGVNIVIYTMDGIYYYEPFSIYESRYDYQYFRTGFTSAEDFIEFANEVSDNSQKEKEVSFTKNDRILTLSTCTNGVYTQRYAMHAKLVKTIVD